MRMGRLECLFHFRVNQPHSSPQCDCNNGQTCRLKALSYTWRHLKCILEGGGPQMRMYFLERLAFKLSSLPRYTTLL